MHFSSRLQPVSSRRLFNLFCTLLILLPLVSASAQSGGGVDQTGTNGRHTIQGRIYFPSGRRSDTRVKVKLENFNAGELSVLSDPNGSFVFRGLEPGSYTVVVRALPRITKFAPSAPKRLRLRVTR